MTLCLRPAALFEAAGVVGKAGREGELIELDSRRNGNAFEAQVQRRAACGQLRLRRRRSLVARKRLRNLSDSVVRF
jgi:hypothetical protein